MDVLLVNPPVDKIIEPYDAPCYPHVGLGYLSAYLASRGFSTKVLDSKLERLDFASTLRSVLELRPDVVGITSFTHEIQRAVHLAQEVKGVLPHSFLVLGGVHAMALPEETMRENPCFDGLVSGEGELTLAELAGALGDGGDLRSIAGLAFRQEKKVVVNAKRPWLTNLDELPMPVYEPNPNITNYPILTARGCPYQCIFCMRPYGTKVRQHSVSRVVEEFQVAVEKHRVHSITVRDESFGFDKKRAMEIANLLMDRGLHKRMQFDIETRVNLVDYEFLSRMKMAGCTGVGFGVESGNRDMLKKVGKGITLEAAEKAVAIAKQVGLGTASYFILGHPGETRRTALDTIRFAKKLNTNSVSIGLMIPFPGTRVSEMVEKGEGGYRKLSQSWSAYNKQTGGMVELEGLSRRAMVLMQVLGYVYCYAGNLRFRELFGLLRSKLPEVVRMARNIVVRNT